MVICRNADPFLDGFGIILTMQIPSRLHVIEASKAFSKIAFVKELPVCSSIRTKNTLLKKSTRPLYVPAMARRLPKPLKEKLLKCDGKLIKFYVLTIIPKDTQNKAETDKHIQARFPSICSGSLEHKLKSIEKQCSKNQWILSKSSKSIHKATHKTTLFGRVVCHS